MMASNSPVCDRPSFSNLYSTPSKMTATITIAIVYAVTGDFFLVVFDSSLTTSAVVPLDTDSEVSVCFSISLMTSSCIYK